MPNIIMNMKVSGKRKRVSSQNEGAGTWSPEAQNQYRKVSDENKKEFQVEKRVQELANQGFNEAAISGMTGHSESSVKSMMRRVGKNIILDGKY